MCADKWIAGAVKHPGAVKEAAKESGKSVAAEATSESKSTDPKIASRGRLAMRFKGIAPKGNIMKPKSMKTEVPKKSDMFKKA